MKQCFVFLCLFTVISFKGGAQVNLQTGAAQFSLPMYSYSDPVNRIGTSVALHYTAGNGLRVSEIASSVGTGWNLQAGGYIQRIQNGAADDQKNDDTYVYPALPDSDPASAFWVWAKNYYPNGFINSEFLANDNIPNAAAYTPMYPAPYYYYKPPQSYSADREQDVFKFSFNGREGYFAIGKKNSSGQNEIRTLYNSKLKVEKVEGDLNNTQGIRTIISKFIITDENGIKYVFNDPDIDQVCDYESGSEYSGSSGAFVSNVSRISYPSADYLIKVAKGTPRSAYLKNKWHLSEIINPLTTRTITFQYETYNVDINTNKILNRSDYDGETRITINQERTISQVKRIKKIVCSPLESVEFEYATTDRIDLPGDKYLSGISAKYGNVIKQHWDFTYGYFVKTDIKAPNYSFTTEDKVWARLCLLTVKRNVGGQAEPPYSFDYFRGNEEGINSAVPPMFSLQQDLGGYYSTRYFGFYNPSNGTTSTFNSPYEPYGNVVLTKDLYKNLLEGLSYNPSLGYGTGTSTVKPSIEARNGILKSVTNPLGGQQIYEYELNKVGASSANPFYGVRVKKLTNSDGNAIEYRYVDASNNSSGWGYEDFENKETITVRVMQECGPSSRVPLLNMTSITKPFAQFVLNQLGVVPSSAAFTNFGGTQIPTFAVAFFTFIVFNIINDFFDSGGTEYKTMSMIAYRSSPILTNRLPFQYSRVEVITRNGPTEDIGKVITTFTNPNTSGNFGIDVPTLGQPYSSRQRYAYWIYGLPEIITVKDKAGKTVKETVNTYNAIKGFTNDTKFQSQKWAPLQVEYCCGFRPELSEVTAYNKIASELYTPIFGRIELTKSREYVYNNNNESTYAETEYAYSTGNYLLKKVTVSNSKGEKIETNTYYPDDYSLSGTIQSMKDNNIFNTPISTQTIITKPGNTRYLLSGSVSEFAVASNGDYKAVKTYSTKIDQPVLESSAPFSATQLIPGTGVYIQNGEMLYSTGGAPIQLNNDAGKMASIYDYENKLPIAHVVNANAADIAYTSFEADGNGGWTFDPLKITEDFSPTGKKNLKASPGGNGEVISRAISSSRKYVLSFWKKGDDPVLSGASYFLRRSYLNPATGYTYYEYEVSGGANVSITNRTGSSSPYTYYKFSLDEIRLYPVEARMSTVTYDPVWGKTAEADQNGRISYYEYDLLGRLKVVRDQDRNVIKTYEYNYKQ